MTAFSRESVFYFVRRQDVRKNKCQSAGIVRDLLHLGKIHHVMKKLSIFLMLCLIGTFSVEAQKTAVPAFRTVQVRPGVIKVPSFSLPAGTATRPDLKSISSSNLKAVTETTPGKLVGTVEAGITTSKLNIELTPKNFLSVKGAEMRVVLPILIYDKFFMGDNNMSKYTDIAADQAVIISIDVMSGKQYLIRIPVTVEATAARTFFIAGANTSSYVGLFTSSFTGSHEIAFALVPENTGTIYINFFALPAAGAWSFTKVIISEL